MRYAHFTAILLAAVAHAQNPGQVPDNPPPPTQTSLSPHQSYILDLAWAKQFVSIVEHQPKAETLFRAIPVVIPQSDQAVYQSYQASLARFYATAASTALPPQSGNLLAFLTATVLPPASGYPWVSDLPAPYLSEYLAFETSIGLAEISLGRQILATMPGATPTSTGATAAGAAASTSSAAAGPARTAVAGGVLVGAAAAAALAL